MDVSLHDVLEQKRVNKLHIFALKDGDKSVSFPDAVLLLQQHT